MRNIFCLTLITFLFYPWEILAEEKDQRLEELTEKLIEISLAVTNLSKEIENYLNTFSPLYPQALGDYLKNLFEDNQIYLSEDDFFEKTQYPYLDFAKILNLVPYSSTSSQKISQREAEKISKKFFKIKDKIILDGFYGKIDMHEHYRTGGDLESFLEAAGSLGISKIVFLPTGLGPDNRGYKTHQNFLVKYVAKLYPERIIPFCTVDEADPKAWEILEECLKAGGRGLKLLGGHPNFYDEPLNSENMYKVYEVAKKYQVPVLIHGSIINIPQIKKELNQVFSDFPEITFIHAHYCSTIFKGINLDQCSELLDNHPNLYIDLSMGGGIKRYHRYFREDLKKVKDFILKYQERILFGSDIILDKSGWKDPTWLYQRMKCDIDLHQKAKYSCPFGEKDKIHQGFNLSRDVLRKLYFDNPKKVLGF
jgi:predicted TIM-barrel fold metal-dependent hydrolase